MKNLQSLLIKQTFKTKHIQHVSGTLTTLTQVQFRYVKENLLKIIKTVSVFVLKTTCWNWWERATGGFGYKTYDKDGYSGVCVQNVFITIAN